MVIPTDVLKWLKIRGVVSIFFVGLIVGSYVTHLYYVAAVAERESMLSKESKDLAEKVLAAHNKSIRKLEDQRNDALKKLNDKNIQIDELRVAVANQSVSLRIAARCPLPGSSDPGGVATGTAQLASIAERAYFAHLAALDRVDYMLDVCLATLKEWSTNGQMD